MLKRAFGDRHCEERKLLSGFSSSKTVGPHWSCCLGCPVRRPLVNDF